MAKVTLYTKDNCSLCVKAKEILSQAQKECSFEIEEVDIAKDANLYERYKHAIPVVFIDEKEVFRYNVDKERLKEILRMQNS